MFIGIKLSKLYKKKRGKTSSLIDKKTQKPSSKNRNQYLIFIKNKKLIFGIFGSET